MVCLKVFNVKLKQLTRINSITEKHQWLYFHTGLSSAGSGINWMATGTRSPLSF